MARTEMYVYAALCCDACNKEGPRVTSSERVDRNQVRPTGASLWEMTKDYRETEVTRIMRNEGWTQVHAVTLCPDCRKATAP